MQMRSKSSVAVPSFLKRTVGGGFLSTSPWLSATSCSMLRTAPASVSRVTDSEIRTRPVRSVRTRLRTTPETRFEFGTMTLARSKVAISVERTLMRLTMPSTSPTTT